MLSESTKKISLKINIFKYYNPYHSLNNLTVNFYKIISNI